MKVYSTIVVIIIINKDIFWYYRVMINHENTLGGKSKEEELTLVQQSEEGGATGEDQSEKSPEKTNEDSPEENNTEKEEKVKAFTERFESLEYERMGIMRHSEITHALYHMQYEGMSTVIRKFGTDTLIDHLTYIREGTNPLDEEDRVSEYDRSYIAFLKKLVPDPESREALFDEMEQDVEEQIEREKAAGKHSVITKQNILFNTNTLRYIHDVESGINESDEIGLRFKKLINKVVPFTGWFEGFEKGTVYIGGNQKRVGYKYSNEELTQQLKDEFEDGECNMETVLWLRRYEAREREVDLFQARLELENDIMREIDAIKSKIDAATTERKLQILQDTEKMVATLRSVSSEEAERALQGAVKTVEDELNELITSAEEEFVREASPYTALLEDKTHSYNLEEARNHFVPYQPEQAS